MTVTSVDDASFEREVLRAELPVLIDLYADWCEPCKQLSPIVADIATELEGKLKVVKCDIERSPRVAQSFRVQSIPMLVVIHQGQIAGHHVGLLDKRGVLALVEPVLPAEAAEVKPEELAQLLKLRRVVPVDIRDPAVFARYRIPGAINVPAADVQARAEKLRPSDGRIRVLYSRSTDDAKELAEKLRAKGIEVGFLAGGFLHWEADGHEVERGA
jgi:thioredoxin